jgi:hypothetical protein
MEWAWPNHQGRSEYGWRAQMAGCTPRRSRSSKSPDSLQTTLAMEGGAAELSSRATDETGYIQPTRRALIDVRGPGSLPYHLNPIVSWIVEKDGRVIYKAEPWV